MDKEEQEIIARALYESCVDMNDPKTPQYEQLLSKNMWRERATAVVEAYINHKKTKEND